MPKCPRRRGAGDVGRFPRVCHGHTVVDDVILELEKIPRQSEAFIVDIVLGKGAPFVPSALGDIGAPPLHKMLRQTPGVPGTTILVRTGRACGKVGVDQPEQPVESCFVAAVRCGRHQNQMTGLARREAL